MIRAGMQNRLGSAAGIAAVALIAAGAVLTPIVTAPSALAAPQPEPIPRRWELQVTAGPLRVASIETPGKGPLPYLFFTYKVVNKSGEDRWFAPSFELDNGDGEIQRSGRDVPREVVDALVAISGNSELLDEIKIQGPFQQGEENAKEGIVVWPCTNLKPDFLNLYLGGFSGETKSVTRPDNGQTVVLRKQFMLRHQVNGELNPDSQTPIARVEDRWILRK